jgi:hypothetical protein
METSLHKHFTKMGDPRINRNKKHLLIDIIILTILAVLSGAESWDSIESFGKTKIDFLLTLTANKSISQFYSCLQKAVSHYIVLSPR